MNRQQEACVLHESSQGARYWVAGWVAGVKRQYTHMLVITTHRWMAVTFWPCGRYQLHMVISNVRPLPPV